MLAPRRRLRRDQAGILNWSFALNASGLYKSSSDKLLLVRTTIDLPNIKNFAYLESLCFNPRRLLISDSSETSQNGVL
jgi:hypothetical protein